jgi:hypothetical protein
MPLKHFVYGETLKNFCFKRKILKFNKYCKIFGKNSIKIAKRHENGKNGKKEKKKVFMYEVTFYDS